jgi:predicted nucleotidyltransferase
MQGQSLLEVRRTVEIQVIVPREKLSDFCQRWKVTELALFGSVLREDFSPDSDLDVLVTFAPHARWSLFDLVVMESELQAILGREVDLVERTAVEQADNYIRRKSILSNIEVIYAA